MSVGANVGAQAIGVFVSGLLVQYAPYPTTLVYAVSIVSSLGAGIALALTPETLAPSQSRKKVREQRIAIPRRIKAPFWISVGGVVACYSIFGLFGSFAPSFLQLEIHIQNHVVAGAFVSLFFGMAALVQLVDRRTRDRSALEIGLPILFVSLVILLVGVAAASLPVFLAVAILLGIGVGWTFMGSVSLIDRVAPEERRGELLSGFYVAGFLALAIPTVGVGEAADTVGLQVAGIGFAILLAITVAVVLVATVRTPTPPDRPG